MVPISLGHKKPVMSIPQVFEGKSVFITGGSGFIGKVLIEKLLRTCPGLKNIYILMRPKKNMTIQERIAKILNVPLFDKLRKDNIEYLDKVLGIKGDIMQLNLGLSDQDVHTLVDNVSIIYHIAASVRFDDLLRSAILINTRSTREVITLAKQLKSLDVFVHCSTAYSNFDHDVIEEKVYPPKQDWRIAIELAENYDEMTLQALTEKCIHPMPNTYTYTKGLAEQVVIDLCTNQIPAIIMRPSIVLPTLSDPIEGWIDNYNGPIILNLVAGKGLLKTMYCDSHSIQDHVLVDNTVKVFLIATAKKTNQSNNSTIEVYNIASDVNFTIRFDHMIGKKLVAENPPESYLGIVDTTFLKNSFLFYLATMVFHVLPAIIVDSILLLTGMKPKLIKIYRKIFIANASLRPFVFRTVDFKTENYVGLEDYVLESDKSYLSFINYRMAMNSEETERVLGICWRGIKKYLIKEKTYATEAEIKRYQWLVNIKKMVFFVVKGYIVYVVISKLLLPFLTSQLDSIIREH